MFTKFTTENKERPKKKITVFLSRQVSASLIGSLFARLVLDVLSDKVSRDYTCDIKVDEDFETAVYELRAYFDFFFKLAHTCETILNFYFYDEATNYVKYNTGGLQGDPPEFIFSPLVTLHLWGRIFKKFPDLRGLAFADDGNRTAFPGFEAHIRNEARFQTGWQP